jgi:hypothetical protein
MWVEPPFLVKRHVTLTYERFRIINVSIFLRKLFFPENLEKFGASFASLSRSLLHRLIDVMRMRTGYYYKRTSA